jgi:carbamoyltransferase
VCDLLTRYYEITGIPLLCNTSANLNGSGFFPDVESAMRWPHSHCIWHSNVLYTRGEEVL